jgi:hypothetical protein
MQIHFHRATDPGVLCGARNGQARTTERKEVTCPLCEAILAGRQLAHAIVDDVESRLTTKLADVQRDPAVRAVAALIHGIVNADRVDRR